jgi:hypothetical protein
MAPCRFLFNVALGRSVVSASSTKKNDGAVRARTIVTFADLYRDTPGVVASSESSFVVLIDECKYAVVLAVQCSLESLPLSCFLLYSPTNRRFRWEYMTPSEVKVRFRSRRQCQNSYEICVFETPELEPMFHSRSFTSSHEIISSLGL